MDTTQIARNIRAELARQSLTQDELAQRAGIAASTLWRRLRVDAPTGLTVAELVAIAEALDLDLVTLTRGAPAPGSWTSGSSGGNTDTPEGEDRS